MVPLGEARGGNPLAGTQQGLGHHLHHAREDRSPGARRDTSIERVSISFMLASFPGRQAATPLPEESSTSLLESSVGNSSPTQEVFVIVYGGDEEEDKDHNPQHASLIPLKVSSYSVTDLAGMEAEEQDKGGAQGTPNALRDATGLQRCP